MDARADEITPKQLADMVGVEPVTVYKWIRLGMPAMRPGPRGWFRIRYADYVKWAESCVNYAK